MDRILILKGESLEVPERIYLIHIIAGFTELKSVTECNNFVRTYCMDRSFFNKFYTLITGQKFKRSGYYMYERLIDRSLSSLDSLIWICKYFNLTSSMISLERLNSSYFDLMFDKYINYPDKEFSESFRSIRTLLSFYLELIDNFEHEHMSCNYLIPVTYINQVLSNCTHLREVHIEKDLNNQGIISKVNDDYYQWINKSVLDWFNRTSSVRIFELNQYKLLKDL